MEISQTENLQNPLQEDLKQKLEIEKLQNEVKYQKNPLRNPSNWAPFATMIGTSFALIWAISSGWFTNQNDKITIQNNILSIQKLELKKEIENFTAQKNSLVEQNARLRDSINSQINIYKKKIAAKNEIVRGLNADIGNTYFELLSNLNNEMARMVSMSTSELQDEQLKVWKNAINLKDGKNRILLEKINKEVKQINTLLKN